MRVAKHSSLVELVEEFEEVVDVDAVDRNQTQNQFAELLEEYLQAAHYFHESVDANSGKHLPGQHRNQYEKVRTDISEPEVGPLHLHYSAHEVD
jgi:membrane-bound lytic murein transglycosylase B